MEAFKYFFMWSTVLNVAFLLVWVAMFLIKRDFMYGLHSRWFKLSPESFDAIHYSGIALYKLMTLFLTWFR